LVYGAASGAGALLGRWASKSQTICSRSPTRRLLINGASANLLRSKATNADPWVIGLRRRRPSLVVAVALANKTARIAWAVMHRQENYRRVAAAA
jgi:transposase